MISFSPESALTEELHSPIDAEQLRTRDRVFNTVGNVTGFSVDATRFLTKEAAYLAGSTINVGVEGARALYRGVTGQPHP